MRHFLPIISIILLWTTLPQLDWGIVAWVALIPLLLFIELNDTQTKEVILWSGIVVASYMFLLLWPLTSVNVWWWVNPESFIYTYKTLVLIATISIGSLYGGFVPGALFGLIYKKNHNALLGGVAWGALELLRIPFVYDFTWVSLGYSQHDTPFILSLTPFIGIAGLSAFIVTTNILLARSIMSKKRSYVLWIFLLITVVGIINLPFSKKSVTETISVSSVHLENQTQELYNTEEVEETLSLIEEALQKDPHILVTPENIFPFLVLDNNFVPHNYTNSLLIKTTFDRLMALSKEHPRSSLVVGIHTKNITLQNSMVVIQNGSVTDIYHKESLLIFGERPPLPFKKNHIAPLTPGTRLTLKVGEHTIKPLICSEIATDFDYPKEARFMININNDSIFTSPLVGLQNLYVAQTQAVRHNSYIIRSGKGGVTALISPSGEIVAQRTTTGFIFAEISL